MKDRTAYENVYHFLLHCEINCCSFHDYKNILIQKISQFTVTPLVALKKEPIVNLERGMHYHIYWSNRNCLTLGIQGKLGLRFSNEQMYIHSFHFLLDQW